MIVPKAPDQRSRLAEDYEQTGTVSPHAIRDDVGGYTNLFVKTDLLKDRFFE
jgi:hypothetical protein